MSSLGGMVKTLLEMGQSKSFEGGILDRTSTGNWARACDLIPLYQLGREAEAEVKDEKQVDSS